MYDENKATSELSSDSRQQIPGPLPVGKPWESTAYKPEHKGNREENSCEAVNLGFKKKKPTSRDKSLLSKDERSSFIQKESLFLPSSWRDSKNKDLDKFEAEKDNGKSMQHHTGTSTIGKEINNYRDAPDSEMRPEKRRLSLVSDSSSLRKSPLYRTRDDYMDDTAPSKPQATSSPILDHALPNGTTPTSPPPAPERFTADKSTMDTYGEFIGRYFE